jgi:hypothetical protein
VQLLAFELASRRLALPVDPLETIVRAAAITPLPQSPPFPEITIGESYFLRDTAEWALVLDQLGAPERARILGEG